MNFHHIENRLEGCLKRIEKIPEPNRSTILKFRDECYANGISNTRVLFYLKPLQKLGETIKKPFQEVTKEEIKAIVAQVEQKKVKGNNASEWTKAHYKLTIKKFYQWLDGFDWRSKKYPDRVEWIHSGAQKSKLPRPIILTKEEILKIFKAARDVREKALATFLYESGCRSPDESLNMKIKDVEFDKNGARIRLCSGKVGERIIRVVACIPYLKAWIQEQHPNPNPDSYLWVKFGKNSNKKPISYITLTLIVKRWAKDAEISKRVTPYTFRRSRYTHLSTKIPTPALYKYMGQVLGSDVIERYVALNDEDTDTAILNFYGIKQAENGDIKPMFCSRCGKQSPPEKEFCVVCDAPLTDKAMIEVEEKKKVEMTDFVEELIKKRMEEFKGNQPKLLSK